MLGTDCLQHLSLLIAEFTGILCELSEAFRRLARGLIRRVKGLGRAAILLGVSTLPSFGLARPFGLLTVLLSALSVLFGLLTNADRALSGSFASVGVPKTVPTLSGNWSELV